MGNPWDDPTVDYGPDAGTPLPCHHDLKEYIEHGRPVGDFLEGLLTNDLQKACSHADSRNQRLIYYYSAWLYNKAPGGCYGSKERYREWVEDRGMEQFER